MLETPSLVYAGDRLFEEADFVSVGGNDLMQFFFAADRENERVRARYDVLSFAFLGLLRDRPLRAPRHSRSAARRRGARSRRWRWRRSAFASSPCGPPRSAR